MKGLLIGGAIILSVVLGFWPGGLSRPKPRWWRWLAIGTMLVVVLFGLGIPTGGSFGAGKLVSMGRGDDAIAPIRGVVTDNSAVPNGQVTLQDANGEIETIALGSSEIDADDLKLGNDVIIAMNFNRGTKQFTAHYIVSVNPIAALPLIPALEERARNIYFHVPTAWISQLAWFVALGYAIVYLRKRRPEDDIRASSAAALGALFCILATVTGAVWARFNWGVFWNWDPRQTSIFIVLIIYGAYFALRSAIENEEQRGRISSVYLAVLALPVTFFMFVLPRIQTGLHPGAANDDNIGPVLSGEADALAVIKQVIFALSFFSFAMLYFWMTNVSVRSRILELTRKRRLLTSSAAAASGGEASPMVEEVIRH